MVSYKARFTNVNDPYARYLIVCVDKTWGQPGCQPWTGDWVQVAWLSPGQYIDSPYFTPTTVLTAVTSSDAGYYYRVDIIDENGNVVYTCDHVDRNTPCYFYPSTSTTTTVSSVTLPGVSPTVSPTTPPTVPTSPITPSISPSPITSPTLSVAPTPTPVTPTPPSKTAMYIAIGAVAIIALAGLGYWLYSRRKK